MTDPEHLINDEWIRRHMVLQKDHMRNNIARLLEDFMPEGVLRDLTGKFVMVCRPPDSPATTIRSETIAGRHVIVLSKYLIPNSNPPVNFPREYIALVLLHELAHISLDHRPPATDQMERDAHELSLTWFNEKRHLSWTYDDLTKLNEQHDGAWID